MTIKWVPVCDKSGLIVFVRVSICQLNVFAIVYGKYIRNVHKNFSYIWQNNVNT